MEKRINRIVERPSGVGNLKRGNEIIAGVIYSIVVTKEILISDNFDGHSEIDLDIGQINGRLKFIEKGIKIEPEEILTLQLSDGREFDISLPLVNFPARDYEFIVRDGKNFKIK